MGHPDQSRSQLPDQSGFTPKKAGLPDCSTTLLYEFLDLPPIFRPEKKNLQISSEECDVKQIRIGYDQFERQASYQRRPSNVYKLDHQYNTTLPVEIITSAGPTQKDLALNVPYLQQFSWSMTPPQPAIISPQLFDEIIDVGRAALHRQATALQLWDFVTTNYIDLNDVNAD